jgi:thiol-disulfide isomerase/thioredoxin
MNHLLLTLFSLLTIAGCGGGDTQGTEISAPEVVDVAQVANDQVVAIEVKGIDERNRGDKQGPIHLHGNVHVSMKGSKLYLYESEGKTTSKIDSVKVGDSTYDFGTKTYSRGFYFIGSGDPNNMTPIILNPDESDVQIDFKSARFDALKESPNSGENIAWNSYYAQEKQFENQIANLRKSRSQSSFKERVDGEIKQKEDELRALQLRVAEENAGTYLAKFLVLKKSANPGDKSHYWDDVDFTDLSIMRSPIIADRIQDYMRSHSGGEESGFLNCVDILKEKAAVNSQMLEFTLYTMLDGFYQSGMENVSMYILDNYIFDDDCGADLSDVVKQRAQGIVNLQVGKTPSDFTIEKVDGGKLNLYSEVAKNEYTLVMFWASWCHKCEQEIPVLKGVYDVYRSRGFQVVGVSVDNQRVQWENAVKTNDVKWPNVSQLNAWNSPVAKEYRVTQTPTLFLLNKNKEIVLKPKRIFEVEAFLKANLK